jgi:hypothetical protein
MDPLPTFREAARVLRPGGTLAAIWSGPDRTGPFVTHVRAAALAHSDPAAESAAKDFAAATTDDRARTQTERFEVPDGVGFSRPEHDVFRWTMPLDADQLIGLLGTFSAIITMNEERRNKVLETARQLLRDDLGVDGTTAIDIEFRCQMWKCRYLGT